MVWWNTAGCGKPAGDNYRILAAFRELVVFDKEPQLGHGVALGPCQRWACAEISHVKGPCLHATWRPAPHVHGV